MSYNEDDWLESAFEDKVTEIDPFYLNSDELDNWDEEFEDDEL